MNKLLLSILLVSSTAVYSQELDEAYLKSLPIDIRNDVLMKIEQRADLDETIYRRQPSTMIKKSDYDEKIFQNKQKIVSKTDKLTRFGENMFSMMQSSFMPINEPNFDSSYVLDFGDIIELQLIGQKNMNEELSVKRDGSINIPEIGKIFVSGLSLDTVSKLIKSKVSTVFTGVDTFVTLVNVRDIQVLITGNAYSPGIYTLNGNTNILQALNMAGGIDENGSYRHIDLIRNNVVIKTVDLYDFFIHGKSGFGERLRSGDAILIRPATKILTLSGAVKRPALYELKSNEGFSDLLKYGNGFSDLANIESLRVERMKKNEVLLISVENLKKLESLETITRDRLDIGSYERKTVRISGAISSPGTYILSKGETLSSLIKKANGYKFNAYPFGGILDNKKTLELNKSAVEKLYTTFIQKLISKGDALFASESLPFILDELKKSEISGRIMAEFDLDVIQADPSLDTTLDDGDEIIIPIKTEQVYIFGEVNNSGAVRYQSNQSIDSYIVNAGGALKTADINNIFVVHPNGEVNRVESRLSFLNRDSILVYPGSVIYVPREVLSRDPTALAAIWAPLVSSMATSITALSVLNKQ